MADTMTFISPLTPTLGGQQVYWKQRWQDAWELQPDLWANETVWTCAPSISTASLQRRYGDVLKARTRNWTVTSQAAGVLRYYIRIDHAVGLINPTSTAGTTRSWYGFLDIDFHELLGWFTDDEATYGRGRQHFVAYGLEKLLDETPCVRSQVKDGEGTGEVGRALTMNPRVQGHWGPTLQRRRQEWKTNRASATVAGGVYPFHDERTGGDAWSSRDAVKYLLEYDTPRGPDGQQAIEWQLSDPYEIVPTWDAPEVVRQGRTCWELLSSLLARQRLYSFVVRPSSAAAGAAVQIVPFTFNADALTLDLADGESGNIPANTSQLALNLTHDRTARLVIKSTSADVFDQVRFTGARKTSTGTFSFIDDTLAIGWSTTLETAYEAGASGEPDYPAAEEIEQRSAMNTQARALDKFKPVYARFILKEPWDGTVGDGTAGTPEEILMPTFADEESEEPDRELLAPEDQRFLPLLPLLDGYDYSGTKIEDDEVADSGQPPHLPLEPIVLFPVPDDPDVTPPDPPDKKYRHAEKIGLNAELEAAGYDADDFWHASVRVDPEDGALWVTVSSTSQDVIAKTDFSRLADLDFEPAADYRDMLATLTVPWSSYAEGVYPAQVAAGVDVVRTLELEAGDDYRLDYVVPGTVVAIDAGGNLVRTDSGGFVRDDRGELEALAKLAYQWYGRARRALHLETSLANDALQVGMLVISVVQGVVLVPGETFDSNSVITSIRLATPLAEGEGPLPAPVPRMAYETAFGELDVLKLR